MTEYGKELSKAEYLATLSGLDQDRVVGCAEYLRSYFYDTYPIPGVRMAVIAGNTAGFLGRGGFNSCRPLIRQPLVTLNLIDDNPSALELGSVNVASLDRMLFQIVMASAIEQLICEKRYSAKEYPPESGMEFSVTRISFHDSLPIHLIVPSASCEGLSLYMDRQKFGGNYCILAEAKQIGEAEEVKEVLNVEDNNLPEIGESDEDSDGIPF